MSRLLTALLIVLFASLAYAGVMLTWQAAEGEFYTVYRNGAAIANTQYMTYTDGSAAIGDCYTVTATVQGIESPHSNQSCTRATKAPYGLLWKWVR